MGERVVLQRAVGLFPEKEDGWTAEATYQPCEESNSRSLVDCSNPGARGMCVNSADRALAGEQEPVIWSSQHLIGDLDKTILHHWAILRHWASVFPSSTEIVFESDS